MDWVQWLAIGILVSFVLWKGLVKASLCMLVAWAIAECAKMWELI